jgi:UDP-N-acetylmuramate--alanine ligase
VTEVYAAGEEPVPGVNRDALVGCMRKRGREKVHALESPEALGRLVCEIAKPGDFVICLGAGSVTQWAHALPRALEAHYGINPKQANGA